MCNVLDKFIDPYQQEMSQNPSQRRFKTADPAEKVSPPRYASLSQQDNNLLKLKDPLFKKFQKQIKDLIHNGVTPVRQLNHLSEPEK